MSYKLLAFLFFFCRQTYSLQENYYWREYTGSIPSDAVVGGKDINGNDIYIGQVYVKNKGLIVTTIYPGKVEVIAVIGGVHRLKEFIKILCGPQKNFYWTTANSSDLHLLLIDKHAVIGGHEDDYGLINIGRISLQGESKIGKVNSFNVNEAKFFFDQRNEEKSVTTYEILIFDNNHNIPRNNYYYGNLIPNVLEITTRKDIQTT